MNKLINLITSDFLNILCTLLILATAVLVFFTDIFQFV